MRRLVQLFAIVCFVIGCGRAVRANDEVREGPVIVKPADHGVGRLVADVAFTDLRGKTRKLSDFADQKAVVVLMTGTGCPLCQKYAPTLAALERQFARQGIAFVFVNPAESETVKDCQEAVSTHGFQGSYVRDETRSFAVALGARTTTEAFVLDAARTLVYRGAVDDQYGLAYALKAARHTYLADALRDLLAGRPAQVAATTSPGCDIYFDDKQPVETEVTWHNRISRIVQNNCQECHRDGGVGPFSLETYGQAKDYAAMIARVVDRKTMPPWFADESGEQRTAGKSAETSGDDTEHGIRWANDRSLSTADRADLLAWVKAGIPVGDPADAPLPRTFPREWAIGQPDLILQLPDPISVQATGRMPYKHVSITTTLPEDRWVQAVEIQPTSPAVVHHVLVFVRESKRRGPIDERTGFFAAYVPGNSHQQYPAGFAKKLPAGSTLTFQLHYTPNGQAAADQTRLGLVFSEEEPRHAIRNIGIANHRIAIPPGASNHREQTLLRVPTDVRILGLMPHMHLRGKAFQYELVSTDGERTRLLNIPRYDFNWQLEYRLARPLPVSGGSQIAVTAWYDNSSGNPANPDPNRTVRWGPQTEDEMMLGYVEYFIPGEQLNGSKSTSQPPQKPSNAPLNERAPLIERAFKRFDRNNDGKVTAAELGRPQLFRKLDANRDGAVTLPEAISGLKSK